MTIEFPHLLKLIEHVEFDTIYHEHYSYISLIRHRAGVQRGMACGSTMSRSCRRTAGRCAFSRRTRDRADLKDSASLQRVAGAGSRGRAGRSRHLPALRRPRARPAGARCSSFLARAKREGKRVAAYGAAAKGNTLLNFCGVTREDIALVADRNPHKQAQVLAGHAYPGGVAGGADAGDGRTTC